jgi:D-sedoheptulose 7-phosphate isomerase
MEIKENLEQALLNLQEFIFDARNIEAIEKAGDLMIDAINSGNKIISCGNGGSMCDAMHFAQEMTGRFKNSRKALPAIAISDPTHLTCVGNDYGFAHVFEKYVEALGKENDILLAISTSGNSENVIKAAQAAKIAGMKIIGLTGNEGGKLGPVCDIEIRAPRTKYADRAQEIHVKVIHCLIDYIENKMGLNA